MLTSRQGTLSAKETIDVTLHLALEHHDRREMGEASALYREILAIDPTHADSLFLLGMIAIADGEQQAAITLLHAAVKHRPKATHMHTGLAEALLSINRAAAALQCYWRILSLEPENPQAYVKVGNTLRQIKPKGGNDALAACCYRRALLIDAGCAAAHFGLGHVYRHAGKLEQAQAEYREALAEPVPAQQAGGPRAAHHTFPGSKVAALFRKPPATGSGLTIAGSRPVSGAAWQAGGR